jgi:hypothetical protein
MFTDVGFFFFSFLHAYLAGLCCNTLNFFSIPAIAPRFYFKENKTIEGSGSYILKARKTGAA